MTQMLQRCFRPIFAVNARLLIGGGGLGVIILGEAAFAYGPNLV
jgi:hypothetical protein